jgi:Uma2 family endonuclease
LGEAMSQLQTPVLTDTWVSMPWDEYAQRIEDPRYEKAKSYYYQGHTRIEMQPVGRDHAGDHAVIMMAILLYATLTRIAINGLVTCSFRKAGVRECQPDLAYYIGDRANAVPSGTNIVNLDFYPAPNLVIEIAKTTLLDDLGTKRSLYEAIGVAEYWVVDVEKLQIIAYTMTERGSQRIEQSQVLPHLSISLLEEALQRSRQTDQSQVGAWIMSQFQS